MRHWTELPANLCPPHLFPLFKKTHAHSTYSFLFIPPPSEVGPS
jgi:hypothetical protein